MYFDYQDKLLVCTIDKVGSTTWLAHFKNLAAKRIPEFNLADTSRDETRDIVYALNKGRKKNQVKFFFIQTLGAQSFTGRSPTRH